MSNIYHIPNPGQLPFVASYLFNDNPSLSASQKQEWLRGVCKTAVECGFNLAMQSVKGSSITPLMKAMEGTGLKMILGNAQLSEDAHWQNFVNGYKTFESLGGWYLARLPKFNDLSNLKNYYNRILSADPDHLIYMQLLEGMSTDYTGNCYSYMDYLRCLQGLSYYINSGGAKIEVPASQNTLGIKPMIWSNNYNPVSYKPTGTVIYYAPFYKMLNNLRTIAQTSGHPFWTFCQCERVDTESEYRQGTPASMRLQCYSALAYGAQGLIFSSYQQSASTISTSTSNSPIDINCDKTDMWYKVQSLLAEIKGLTHIFLGGTCTSVRHTGNLGIEQPNVLSIDNFGPCQTISAGEKGVLCSLLSNSDGKNTYRYLIIVNHDIDNPQALTLRLKSQYTVVEETPLTILTPASTELCKDNGSTRVINRNLAPGGCLILRYQ